MEVGTRSLTACRGYIQNPRQDSPGSWNPVDVSVARRERGELGPGAERSRRHRKSIPVTQGSWDRAPNAGMFDVSVACVPLHHANVACPNRPEGASFKRLNGAYGTGQSEREWQGGGSNWCREPGQQEIHMEFHSSFYGCGTVSLGRTLNVLQVT